ncbi:hypothetical protein FLBR109950_02080 [Flavobacterium branchiophilum]|uniref:Uncharacterized protein n=2 Tax=Flavobacterium branchiophilum TaxID=55197 RepID=G2Z7B6_FLABF|nr:Hypothetical protein FBFL15_0921 [Flavobacterium branchiophilum FL-15]
MLLKQSIGGSGGMTKTYHQKYSYAGLRYATYCSIESIKELNTYLEGKVNYLELQTGIEFKLLSLPNVFIKNNKKVFFL